ncbi:MAG: PEP-CTERM sorting domain-containing protein [Leptolyngbya sp. PLA1]|nr:PEP-CTERM sorting domain-containing protein [Leptolyngbya sp. PLA1]
MRCCPSFTMLLSLAVGSAACAQVPGIFGIGDLPGGGYSSSVTRLSGDGRFAVGRSTGTAGAEAVRWSLGGGLSGLGDIPGGAFSSQAYDSSFDGQVIVGTGQTAAGGDAVSRAVLWDGAAAPQDLGTLRGTLGWSAARGVSANGQVVVGSAENPARFEEAFRWTRERGMEGLGILPGASSSVAEGVSGDGSVVVGLSSNRGFRWTAETGMQLITPQANASFVRAARAVSPDGLSIVGYSDLSTIPGGREAFLSTPAGTIGLGWLPYGGTAPFSEALGVSGDGRFVVGYSSNIAFIWDASHGMRRLSDALLADHGLSTSGWSLGRATSISADGMVISGNGLDPQGRQTGWVVVLPAPGAAGLLLAGLSISARRRR